MSLVPELLAANDRYAATFDKGHLPRPPSRHLAIVTCLDGRINPLEILGLGAGEANVIRNAGGRAAEAIRSLVISQHFLGTREIIVMHHTDCGLAAFGNEEIRARVAANLGADAGALAEEIDFLPIPDLEQGVRADVELLRDSPLLLSGIPITGMIYDVRTGRLQVVAADG
jgi:carbonic anhydrase